MHGTNEDWRRPTALPTQKHCVAICAQAIARQNEWLASSKMKVVGHQTCSACRRRAATLRPHSACHGSNAKGQPTCYRCARFTTNMASGDKSVPIACRPARAEVRGVSNTETNRHASAQFSNQQPKPVWYNTSSVFECVARGQPLTEHHRLG